MLLRQVRAPLLISLASFVAATLQGVHPTGEHQLFMMLMTLIWLCSLLYYAVRTIWNWRTEVRTGLAALGLLCLAPALSLVLSRPVRDLIFQYELPRYQAAMRWAASQAVAEKEVLLNSPSQYADLGKVIVVGDSKTCGLTVDFLWGDGFPVKHVQRRYTALPLPAPNAACGARLFRARPLAPNWFELSG